MQTSPNAAAGLAHSRIEVSAERPLQIWRFRDGLRGHENQTLGLTQALAECVPTEVCDVRVAGLFSQTAFPSNDRRPHLLIGAGRRTHRPMLRAKQQTRARAVVLMRPRLRASEFDLSIVPAHDGVAPSDQVLVTRGALNPIRANARKNERLGLIAIGGPSAHHDWLDAEVISQIRTITANSSPNSSNGISWTIANSRRTPASTWQQLINAQLHGVTLAHWRAQESDWFARTMANADNVWVSEDSVSMLYEALSGGAGVGILAVPRRRAGRVVGGVAQLITDGLATPFGVWQSGRNLTPPEPVLAEAERSAQWLVDKWLLNR